MKRTKLVAFCLALTLFLVSFSACSGCGKKKEDAKDSSSAVTQNVEESKAEEGKAEEGKAEEETAAEDEESKTNAENSSKDPYELFQNAVSKGKPKSASYDLTATNATFSTTNDALTKLVADLVDQETVRKQNGKNCAATTDGFAAVKKDNCKSAQAKETEQEYKLTFQLKNNTVPATAQPPKAGYLFFLDAKTVEQTVQKANEKIEFKKTGTIALSGGTLQVTINKTTGKITKATLNFSETYTDKVDLDKLEVPKILSGVEVTAKFAYTVKVTYAF